MINKKAIIFSNTIADLRNIILSVLLISVSSQISIPLPNGVPMTLQTLSIAFCGYCLSRKNSIKTILSYIFLGAIGLPIFAQYKSGFSTVFGLTGGFIFGFIFLVLLCSKAKETKNLFLKILFGLIGLILCHLFGVLQYSFLTGISVIQSAILVSIPFLIKDSISIILALLISKTFEKSKQLINE